MSSDTILDDIYTKLNEIENRVIVLETRLATIGNFAKLIIGGVAAVLGVNLSGIL